MPRITLPTGRWQPDVADEYRRLGFHSDGVIAAELDRALRSRPDAVALIDDRSAITYRELHARSARVASGLRAAGIVAGDVVAWQAPNRIETVVLTWACWTVGAVVAPIVSLYREKELSEILAMVEPAAVATVAMHRGHAFAETFDDVLTELGSAPVKILLDGARSGWTTFADLCAAPPSLTDSRIAADDPALVIFTSGTTSGSKGVVHSSRTLLAETAQFARAIDWGVASASHVPTPLAHISGLLRGITAPVHTTSTAVLREHWDSERVVADMADLGITHPVAPANLLGELLDAWEAAGRPPHRTRLLTTMGTLSMRQRAESYGFVVGSSYGMSELPTISLPDPSDPPDRRHGYSGRLCAGVEARVHPDSGELEVRGPEQMLGYLDQLQDDAVWTEDLWIRTGDIAQIEDGYVRVVGRIKDVISRGGEKISAVEVEDCLIAHPAITGVAVVAGPHQRLGEVPVAFLTIGSAERPSDAALVEFLDAAGLARHKVPDRWIVVDELPLTASGKVRKRDLALLAATPHITTSVRHTTAQSEGEA